MRWSWWRRCTRILAGLRNMLKKHAPTSRTSSKEMTQWLLPHVKVLKRLLAASLNLYAELARACLIICFGIKESPKTQQRRKNSSLSFDRRRRDI
nr:hypothetical protein [Tanacetum cinerariifolium]